MRNKSLISRRFFIKNVSLFSGGLVLAFDMGSEDAIAVPKSSNGNFSPNLFVELKPNGDLI